MSITDGTVLPLTTTFHLSSCAYTDDILSSVSESSARITGDTSSWFTWSAITEPEPERCYPTGWNTVSYYSPGICPDGYYMAETSEDVSETTGRTTTHGTCCFNDFVVATGDENYGNQNWICVQTPVDVTKWANGPDSHYTMGGAVFVRWQSDDFTTAPATSTTSSTAAISTISISTASTTARPTIPISTATVTKYKTSLHESPADSGSSSGLSTGAKAGVGVGVACGAIVLIAGIVAAIFLRRRRNAAQESYGAYNAVGSGAAVEPKDFTDNREAYELPVSDTHPNSVAPSSAAYGESGARSSVTHELQGPVWNSATSSGGNGNGGGVGELYELPSTTRR